MQSIDHFPEHTTMNSRAPRGGRDAKDPEAGTHLEFLQPGPSNHYQTVYQPPIDILYEDRPRTIRRRRFWPLFACTFLAFSVLYWVLPGVLHKRDVPSTPSVSNEPHVIQSRCLTDEHSIAGTRHLVSLHLGALLGPCELDGGRC